MARVSSFCMTAVWSNGGDRANTWEYRDQDHVQQILASLKLAYLPGMTPVMRDALASG